MMRYGWSPLMGGGFGFGWIFGVIFWIFVIWLLFVLLTRDHRYDDHTQTGNHALDILKERYAKGEIDKKEFDEKKKDLS